MGQHDERYTTAETEEPDGIRKKRAPADGDGTGMAGDNGMDQEDVEKAGMRPTGSGGSAPPHQDR